MRRLVLSLSLALMMLTGAVASAAPTPKAPASGPGPMTTANTPPPAGCAWTQVGASAWTSATTPVGEVYKVQAVLQESYSSVSGFCGQIRTVGNYYTSVNDQVWYDQWDYAGGTTKYGRLTNLGGTIYSTSGSFTLYGPASNANIWCGYNSNAWLEPALSGAIQAATGGLCTF